MSLILSALTSRPDFRHIDCANFQTHLEEQIPSNPELHNDMAMDTGVENFSGADLKVLAASTPKCRTRGDPRPPIPAAETVAGHQGPRSESLGQPPAEVGDPPTQQWRNDHWSATVESLDPEDQSLCRMTKRAMRIPTLSSILVTLGDSLSQTPRKPKP